MTLFKRSLSLLSMPHVRTRLWSLLLALAVFVPVGSLHLWPYVYGFIGDLTPATWVLLFLWFGFPRVFDYWVGMEFTWQRRLLLLFGMALFYILALGSWNFDPYTYGYQPWVILISLGAWVIWRGRDLPGMTLLLAVDLAIFALHGLTSDNLWDYLIDPVLMIVIGISVIRGVMSGRFKSTG